MKLLAFYMALCLQMFYSSNIWGYSIRVLIDEKDETVSHCWTLTCDDHFTVSDIHKSARQERINSKHMTLDYNNGVISLNGKRVTKSAIKIRTASGYIQCGDYKYPGEMLVICEDNKILLINRVELEEYVEAGLRWEMIPSWPAAALQAGAIAYRTYVVAHVRAVRARHARQKTTARGPLRYDILCTSKNQVYKGAHNCAMVHDAVRKTAGLIITHKGIPINALYDICCGGTIPAHRKDIDFKHSPYLERTAACTFCKNAKNYRWSTVCSLKHFKTLCKEIVDGLPVLDVRVSKQDASGFVHDISINQGKMVTKISGSFVRKSLKLKSGTYTIEKRGNMLHVAGKGHGHQLGLCQYGALSCARQGLDAHQILLFYYPQTVLKKISRAN